MFSQVMSADLWKRRDLNKQLCGVSRWCNGSTFLEGSGGRAGTKDSTGAFWHLSLSRCLKVSWELKSQPIVRLTAILLPFVSHVVLFIACLRSRCVQNGTNHVSPESTGTVQSYVILRKTCDSKPKTYTRKANIYNS